MRWKQILFIFFCAIIIGVPSVGYLYTECYGYLYVSIWNKGESTQFAVNPDVKIEFADKNKNLLAIGESNETYATIEIKKTDGSYCRPELGSTQWQRCHRANAIWLKSWIDQLRTVTVKVNDCEQQVLPANIHKRRFNMLTWWMPHPHIGGSPYTYYNLRLAIDTKACMVVVS